jgi:hypothetical protein
MGLAAAAFAVASMLVLAALGFGPQPLPDPVALGAPPAPGDTDFHLVDQRRSVRLADRFEDADPDNPDGEPSTTQVAPAESRGGTDDARSTPDPLPDRPAPPAPQPLPDVEPPELPEPDLPGLPELPLPTPTLPLPPPTTPTLPVPVLPRPTLPLRLAGP